MKVANCVFQKRMITTHTEEEFEAIYKRHEISITTDHGFGEPDDEYLKRFMIDVIDLDAESFNVCVETYEDFETIEKAIAYALHGAMLLPEQKEKREGLKTIND